MEATRCERTGRRLQILGRPCQLGELIGAGGMGQVFAVEHPTRDRLAVKLLREELVGDPILTSRIEAEARTARRVAHRNVVRVLDCGATPSGEPFVAMKHAPGVPLGALIQREGPLELARVRSIGLQILGGLVAIHRAGVIHADMKSDNVLVAPRARRGRRDHVTIIDFGLARERESDPARSRDHVVSGTPEYMAPEQIRGEPLTAATDLYAVGVILYEMLTGTTPFAGGSTAVIFGRHLTDPVVAPSQRCPDRAIPAPLEAAILRALDKEPERRHRDARRFAAALHHALRPGCRDHATPGMIAFSTTGPTHDWIQ